MNEDPEEGIFYVALSGVIFFTYLIFELILLKKVPWKYYDRMGKFIMITYSI